MSVFQTRCGWKQTISLFWIRRSLHKVLLDRLMNVNVSVVDDAKEGLLCLVCTSDDLCRWWCWCWWWYEIFLSYHEISHSHETHVHTLWYYIVHDSSPVLCYGTHGKKEMKWKISTYRYNTQLHGLYEFSCSWSLMLVMKEKKKGDGNSRLHLANYAIYLSLL